MNILEHRGVKAGILKVRDGLNTNRALLEDLDDSDPDTNVSALFTWQN